MKGKTFLIGISGGSASGKSTVARIFLNKIGHEDSVHLSLDSYYRDISYHNCPEAEINFDSPESIELELLKEHLILLKKGKQVDCPVYDFTTHTRQQVTKTVLPKKYIIVEGLFLFNQLNLGNLFDLKLFVTASDDIRLIRRIRRDIAERGRTLDSVINQYINTVRPMHSKYTEPNRDLADEVIDTHLLTLYEVENRIEEMVQSIKC